MQAKITAVRTNWVDVQDGAGTIELRQGTFDVEVIVSRCELSREEVLQLYQDDVTFELVPVEE